jgi:omega-6 fatty acid desaturase (delta-12 desaturase)
MENMELQCKINTITNKYISKQKLDISIFYLFRDISISISFTCAAYQIKTWLSDILLYKILWVLVYSLGQGTIWTGLWVLGHECGHGAFAKTKSVNDAFGLLIHSFLLVPYYSWQYTHSKHHKYTNHLILGETHVPFLRTELTSQKTSLGKINNIYVKQITNILFNIILKLLIGWPLYLLFNMTGGRIDYYYKPICLDFDIIKYSHFNPYARIFPPDYKNKIIITDIFLLFQLGNLVMMDYIYGLGTSIIWYGFPLLCTNAWLTLYTFLQHTDSKVPHYGTDKFTWLKGALCTIDRPYPWVIDEMHHYIGSTHVLHHLNYRIPFYWAKEATEEIKKVLGKEYKYDDMNFLLAYYKGISECNYVDEITGEQYYKKLI